MKIIIQHNSMVPIYEQLVNQIKALILEESLRENEPLPSVRVLAKEIKASALTVKNHVQKILRKLPENMRSLSGGKKAASAEPEKKTEEAK